MTERSILVAGGGGFIGGHLVADLLSDGHTVRCADAKPIDQWCQVHGDAENVRLDLAERSDAETAVAGVDEVYDLASDMGGIGFITAHKAACMRSVLISTHLLEASRRAGVSRFFFASSACVYDIARQAVPDAPPLRESDAYPAMPEDGYGWEKLFSERMARHYREDYGLETRVARYHNVYGPNGAWTGGREKAPAALARKVVEAIDSGSGVIDIWGAGTQTRSFLFVDDCIRGTRMLMDSEVADPLNIGSEEVVTIDGLVDLLEDIAGVRLERRHDLTAPVGVAGRSSDNTLVRAAIGWEPTIGLRAGMERTYAWVADQVRRTPR